MSIISKLNVEGMSCSHCENAVKSALTDLDGVQKVNVDLKEKTVTIEYDESKTDEKKFKDAIEEAGYDVV